MELYKKGIVGGRACAVHWAKDQERTCDLLTSLTREKLPGDFVLRTDFDRTIASATNDRRGDGQLVQFLRHHRRPAAAFRAIAEHPRCKALAIVTARDAIEGDDGALRRTMRESGALPKGRELRICGCGTRDDGKSKAQYKTEYTRELVRDTAERLGKRPSEIGVVSMGDRWSDVCTQEVMDGLKLGEADNPTRGAIVIMQGTDQEGPCVGAVVGSVESRDVGTIGQYPEGGRRLEHGKMAGGA